MKIESIIVREGGSVIHLGSETYHFAPQPDGRHIAEVENEDHIDALLGIREGFRRARETAAIQKPPAPPAESPETPKTPPAPVKTVEPVAPVKAEGDGQSEDESEDESDDQEGAGEQKPNESKQPEASGDGLDALDRDALVARYTEEFGSAPPANVRAKSIIRALREKAETEAKA